MDTRTAYRDERFPDVVVERTGDGLVTINGDPEPLRKMNPMNTCTPDFFIGFFEGMAYAKEQ